MNFFKLAVLFLLSTSNFVLGIKSVVAQSFSEASILEDDLNMSKGLPWGGRNWPYSQVTNIQEGLVNTTVGKIVIDKHEDTNGSWFGYLLPGKKNFISFFGSKVEGCFVKLVYQYASASTSIEPKTIIPVRLEIGVGDKIVRLSSENSENKYWQKDYTYSVYENSKSEERTGRWYMSSQNFLATAEQVRLLRSSPEDEVKARITFADDSTIIFPIGIETVRRWKNVYSFNSSCKP